MSSRSLAAAVALLCLVGSPGAASDEEGCLFCHRHALRSASTTGRTEMRVQDARGAAHDALQCSDCHPDARTAPHPSPPGPASCIGDCHAGEKGGAAAPSHRRASYGGLTESHRGVVSPLAPCVLCHRGGDRPRDNGRAEARCAGCHPGEWASAATGVHGRFARRGRAEICPDCHRAHQAVSSPGVAVKGKAAAACDGKECHPSVTPAMMRLAGHGAAEAKTAAPWGRALKAGLVVLLAAAGWGSGRALGGPGRRRP